MKHSASSYYRKITESLPQVFYLKPYLLSYLSFLMLLMAFSLSIFLLILYNIYSVLDERRLQVQDSLSYWEAVASERPNFPVAYYYAGLYSVELGESERALLYLERAIELDPTFEKAKNLKEKITQEY